MHGAYNIQVLSPCDRKAGISCFHDSVLGLMCSRRVKTLESIFPSSAEMFGVNLGCNLSKDQDGNGEYSGNSGHRHID